MPGSAELHPSRAAVTSSQLAAVMTASSVMLGVIAASVAEVDEQVTPAQLRILVLVATRPGTNLSTVAEALGVHPSNATRACDRLARAGLLSRADSVQDRRHLSLQLTPEGRALLDTVMDHRRTGFERILNRLEPGQREALTHAMVDFAAAAGEPRGAGDWAP